MRAGHFLACLLCAAAAIAADPTSGPTVSFTAVTDNVANARDAIRIDLFRWSTDAERDQFLAAWNLTAPPAAAGRGGRGGRGPAAEPADGAADAPAAGRGGAGRGGRGGRGGAGAAEAPKPTPEGALAAALRTAPTLGYVWSSEVAGYSVRYALHLPTPDGGERIILITDRRLGAWNDAWKPAGGAAETNYDFSVIELHVNAKGEGEGKTSLTGKVVLDPAAKTLALENYGALPVVFKNVKRK